MRARAPSPSRALGSPSLNARRIPEAFSAKPIAVSPNRAVFHYPRQDTTPQRDAEMVERGVHGVPPVGIGGRIAFCRGMVISATRGYPGKRKIKN